MWYIFLHLIILLLGIVTNEYYKQFIQKSTAALQISVAKAKVIFVLFVTLSSDPAPS